MASIVNIPFNFQPVTTGVTTASYTVPAGKYARVMLKDCLCPALNGTALYNSQIVFAGNNYIVSPAYLAVKSTNNVHRITCAINVSNYSSSQTVYCHIQSGQMNIYGSTTQTIYAYPLSNTGYTTSFTLNGNTTTNVIIYTGNIHLNSIAFSTNFGNIIYQTITADFGSFDELWLKAGDVISFGSGRLAFAEYNNIS
jgi:hypothetical protein